MDDLSTLLHDAVSDVEPADRLAEIRAEIRTAVRPRPQRLGRYAAGGGFLAVAAAVTAVALLSDQTRPAAEDDPGPFAPPDTHAVAVYYVGETGDDRPRLFREFHAVTGDDDLNAALAEIAETPDDPDYVSWWSPGLLSSATVQGDVIRVEVTDEVLNPTQEAVVLPDLVLQSLIYTLQAAVEERLPVQFVGPDGNPVAEVFGRPTSEPLANGPQLEVLSLVSISDPVERLVVTDGFIARGAASSFEGNVPWTLTAADGTVVREGFATAGMDVVLRPWETEPIDVTDLPPGDYVFTARTEGAKPFTDTRTVVIE